MFCVKCGKEIPDDANVCPYCMTKTANNNAAKKSYEISGNALTPQPKKSKKKLIIIIAAIVLVIAIVITSVVLFSKKSDNDDKTKQVNGNEISVLNEDTGSLVSWANMKIDNKKLKLTDEQKAVLTYFDDDYFDIYSTKDLQKYPDIYKNAQISFMGTVIKLLSNTDEDYEALVEVSFDKNQPDCEHTNEFAVVYGKHPENGKITKGDVRDFYGRYTDDKQFDIDGTEDYYPYVNTFYSNETGYARGGYEDNAGKNFDFDFINTVAKVIFGNNIKVTDPVNMTQTEQENIFIPYPSYIVTLDNQSTTAFSRFMFARTNGYISDLRNFETVNQETRSTLEAAGEGYRVYPSADFEHFITTQYDSATKHMYIDYYDKDLNKIWGREFNNVTDIPMDYTAKKIVLVADNDMYVIDADTGKDLEEPLFVGSKSDVILVEDGALLIGKEKKDMIMKVSLDGKIIWKQSAKYNCNYDYGIDFQLVDEKYVFTSVVEIDDLTNGNYAISLDKNGNIVCEEEIN